MVRILYTYHTRRFMKLSNLKELMFSPEWTSELLKYSISGACKIDKKGLKGELIYILLPILYDDVLVEKLSRLKISSNLNSFIKSSENIKYKLKSRVKKSIEFEEITNNSFIYLSNYENLTIDGFLKLEKTFKYTNVENLVKKKYFKAAYNLGCILSKEDYKNIFWKLGVTL